MNLLKHEPFLSGVRKYISENPEVAPYVTEYISYGVQDALKHSQEMARDFESALVGVLAMKGKSGKKLTLEKLQKWYGKSHMNGKIWEAPISKLLNQINT